MVNGSMLTAELIGVISAYCTLKLNILNSWLLKMHGFHCSGTNILFSWKISPLLNHTIASDIIPYLVFIGFENAFDKLKLNILNSWLFKMHGFHCFGTNILVSWKISPLLNHTIASDILASDIRPYIHNWSLEPFSQDYGPSFSHHLCCVC